MQQCEEVSMKFALRSRPCPLRLFSANSCEIRAGCRLRPDHSGLDETFDLANIGRQWLKVLA
jgi:hypothetical protein